MAEIGVLIGASIQMASGIVRGLCPVAVESHGLVAAIEELALTTERLFGIRCVVSRTGEFDLANVEASTHLYYIVQEAVTNAVKHRDGGPVRIHLEDVNGDLYMTVENESGDGRQSEVQPRGLGLRTMRYRAGILGGDFEAGAADGCFRVAVRVSRTDVETGTADHDKKDRT